MVAKHSVVLTETPKAALVQLAMGCRSVMVSRPAMVSQSALSFVDRAALVAHPMVCLPWAEVARLWLLFPWNRSPSPPAESWAQFYFDRRLESQWHPCWSRLLLQLRQKWAAARMALSKDPKQLEKLAAAWLDVAKGAWWAKVAAQADGPAMVAEPQTWKVVVHPAQAAQPRRVAEPAERVVGFAVPLAWAAHPDRYLERPLDPLR